MTAKFAEQVEGCAASSLTNMERGQVIAIMLQNVQSQDSQLKVTRYKCVSCAHIAIYTRLDCL